MEKIEFIEDKIMITWEKQKTAFFNGYVAVGEFRQGMTKLRISKDGGSWMLVAFDGVTGQVYATTDTLKDAKELAERHFDL